MAFVSLVPSWEVTPERSQSRRVNPSGDHSHLSMTRRLGFPSQPTPIGDSSVKRSIAAFRPPESFPIRGIAVPIVNVVLVVEGEEEPAAADEDERWVPPETPFRRILRWRPGERVVEADFLRAADAVRRGRTESRKPVATEPDRAGAPVPVRERRAPRDVHG